MVKTELEDELQPKLNLPLSGDGTNRLPKAGLVDNLVRVGVGIPAEESGVVGKVEELRPELDGGGLGDLCFLEDAEVPVEVSGAVELPAGEIAQRSRSGIAEQGGSSPAESWRTTQRFIPHPAAVIPDYGGIDNEKKRICENFVRMIL